MNYNLTGLILLKNRLNISQKDERIIRYQRYYSISLKDLCRLGDLNGIKWKNKYNFEFTTKTQDYAAGFGHLEVVKWLHYNHFEGFTTDAINGAAYFGHLEVVKWIYRNKKEAYAENAIENAEVSGHLEVVKFLKDTFSRGF